MADSVILLSIMLASPSDMTTDRESVANAIEETNRLQADRSIQFRLINWEEDADPGIGEYAQAVINEQLLNKYDIMIALFGSRLGSVTPNSPSGTVEEVRHALSKTDSPDRQHRLLTFFKRVNVIALDCDVEQIQKLQEFRKELQASNVLYKEYDNAEQLTQQVRHALNQIAERYNRANKNQVVKASSRDSEQVKTSEEELGILDFMQLSEIHIKSATESLSSASTMIDSIGELARHYTQRFAQNTLIPLSTDQKRVLINEFSVSLYDNANKLGNFLESARNSFNVALDSTLSAINIQLLDSEDQNISSADLTEQLESLVNAASSSQSLVAGLRNTIEKLPRLTSQLNSAKRTALAALEQFDFLADDLNNRVASITVRLKGPTSQA